MIAISVKKTLAAGLILLIGLFSLAACSKPNQPQEIIDSSETTQSSRGPLEVKEVTYLVYAGGLCHVDMYVLMPNLKVKKYSINPESDKSYDYFEGELPSKDLYEITEFEISDLEWSGIVNVLTRVDFMTLDEDMSTKESIFDGGSYYVKVETNDSVHVSGGYMAGYDDNADSRRFAEARESITNVIMKGYGVIKE